MKFNFLRIKSTSEAAEQLKNVLRLWRELLKVSCEAGVISDAPLRSEKHINFKLFYGLDQHETD